MCFPKRKKSTEPTFVRTPEFIAECLAGLKEHNIPDKGGLYEKVAAGQVLSEKQLIARGYNYFEARNIYNWLSHEHTGRYENALGWE